MSKSTSKYRDDRTAVDARFIKPNLSVLDLGCGAMLIRKHLPEGVDYVGYDIVLETSDTQLIDLDAYEYPSRHWDYIVLLGVLPWIETKFWTLEKAHQSSNFLILTRKDGRFDEDIERAGWVLKERLPYVDPVEICLYGKV